MKIFLLLAFGKLHLDQGCPTLRKKIFPTNVATELLLVISVATFVTIDISRWNKTKKCSNALAVQMINPLNGSLFTTFDLKVD
jgi:hypothetical protein